MTTLKNLKGTAIQFLDADPVQYVGSWSSGGSVNTARQYGAGIGSSTAGLIFGGSTGSNSAVTEQYNGTAWTEVNDLNAVQIAQASAGTLTSGMSAAGAVSPGANVEDWNGSSWATNPHNINSARQFLAGDGPSNDSVLVVGGEPAPNGALTEIYNGSSWTEVADLNAQRNQLAGVGTVTAFLAVGGSPAANDAELWNGSSWTEVADLNDGSPGLSASGDSGLALAFAGAPGFAATNEAWNGTAWTEVGDLSTGRNFAGSSNNAGNTSAFIASGNTSPGLITATEEWTASSVFTQINLGQVYYNSGSNAFKVTEQPVPGGSWSSGGSTSNRRSNMQGFGSSSTAAIAATGYINPGATNIVNVEEYNGTAWTEVNDVNTARRELWEFGTTAAGIIAGGRPPPTAATESWNGSTWTEVNDLNTARSDSYSSFGTSTSGMLASGYVGPPTTADSETWDGTSWTEVSNVNTARNYAAGFGSLNTSGLIAGGYGTAETAKVESWNGTAWTEITDINSVRYGLNAIGNSVDLGFVVGGYRDSSPAGQKALTELWNGSSWTEISDLSTARTGLGASGHAGASNGIVFNGNPPSSGYTTASEEFVAPKTNTTITVS